MLNETDTTTSSQIFCKIDYIVNQIFAFASNRVICIFQQSPQQQSREESESQESSQEAENDESEEKPTEEDTDTLSDSEDTYPIDIEDIQNSELLQTSKINQWDYPIFDLSNSAQNTVLSQVSEWPLL